MVIELSEKVCGVCEEAFESYIYTHLTFEQKYGRSPDEAEAVEVCGDCYADYINDKAEQLKDISLKGEDTNAKEN